MITIIASGRIGKDAVTRRINEKDYACFSIAAEEKNNVTTWLKVNVYDSTGKRAEVFKKGAIVSVSGSASFGVYNNTADVTLWADRANVEKFAPKEEPNTPNASNVPNTPNTPNTPNETGGEDLPF